MRNTTRMYLNYEVKLGNGKKDEYGRNVISGSYETIDISKDSLARAMAEIIREYRKHGATEVVIKSIRFSPV